MTLRWLAITCDAQRLLTKSQMWGKLWHATVQAGGWVGVRSGREKRLLGKTPQTAPPGQDRNVVNAATKVDPRAMAEPGSRYPEGDGPPQAHIFHMLSPPVFDRANTGSHTPLQVTREPDDRACPYSRPAPPQSSPISRPTHRRRPRRRSPWLALLWAVSYTHLTLPTILRV